MANCKINKERKKEEELEQMRRNKTTNLLDDDNADNANDDDDVENQTHSSASSSLPGNTNFTIPNSRTTKATTTRTTEKTPLITKISRNSRSVSDIRSLVSINTNNTSNSINNNDDRRSIRRDSSNNSASSFIFGSNNNNNNSSNSSSIRSMIGFNSIREGLNPLPSMTIQAHYIDTRTGILTPCTAEDAIIKSQQSKVKASSSSSSHHACIFIESGIGEEGYVELRSWLQHKLNLPAFVIELLSESSEFWSTQTIVLKRSCMLSIIRILPEKKKVNTTTNNNNDNNNSRSHISSNGNRSGSHTDQNERTHLAALLLPNLFISFTSSLRTVSVDVMASVKERSEESMMISDGVGVSGEFFSNLRIEKERLFTPTSSGIFIAWLRFHLNRTCHSLRDLRDHVVKIDELMDRNNNNNNHNIMDANQNDVVSYEDILDIKDYFLQLQSIAEEQDECLESINAAIETIVSSSSSSSLSSFFQSSERSSLTSLHAMTSSTERMGLRLEKRITGLRQRSEQYSHDILNERLSVLTILSTVFLPLTFLTGLWGMNFQLMPELTQPYAYPFALILMISVASGMLCFFKKHGWI